MYVTEWRPHRACPRSPVPCRTMPEKTRRRCEKLITLLHLKKAWSYFVRTKCGTQCHMECTKCDNDCLSSGTSASAPPNTRISNPPTAGLINFVGGEFETASYSCPVVEMNTDASKKSNGAEPSFPLSAAPTMMVPSETLTDARAGRGAGGRHNKRARRRRRRA